jgi:hypothetical protein
VPIFVVASFVILVQRKIEKNSEKNKCLIPSSAVWENQGKIQEKEKNRLFACSVRSFHHPLFSPCCATS